MERRGGGGGEPQVRGRQPRSSELITASISLSDPERRERGREGEMMEEEWRAVGGSSWPRIGHGEKKADY